MNHGPSYPEQRRGVQRPPQLVRTARDVEVDGEALRGYRINRAADDAAGLAISEKMRAQIGGLGAGQRNAQDGISLVQTAEGSLNEMHAMLQRVRELAVQFANGTLSTSDQATITAEVAQLTAEIVRIARQPKFNGIALSRRRPAPITFQVGANDNETISTASTPRSARRRQRRSRDHASRRRLRRQPARPRTAARRSTCRDRRLIRTSRARAPTSARCRTGSSTRSPTWPRTRRT